METIKVNMNPNPLDVQTIHASQNDGEARQWEFELHNNGELIDTSDVKEQMVFKAYKGGTEEILPTNGSVPVTAPFLGDIRYPQGLLTDQEFTYRQSPTEEDGLAKITDIKGNTLVWNQLVQNGNFADNSKWEKGPGASSVAYSNNEAVITIGAAWNNDIRQIGSFSFVSGHKYFASFEAKATVQVSLQLATFNVSPYPATAFARLNNLQTTFKKIASVVTVLTDATDARLGLVANGTPYVGETFTVRNVQIIDLTAMGLDISSPSDFTSLFPLSYYDFNQGSLLSFNGNGIKTVGKNRLNNDSQLWGNYGTNLTGYSYSATRLAPYLFPIDFKKGQTYTISYVDNGALDSGDYLFVGVNEYANGFRIVDSSWQRMPYTFTVNELTDTIRFTFRKSNTNTNCEDLVPNVGIKIFFQLEEGATATLYKPYITSSLSLPISTYFPTGMKSAGTVYDELTENKAITRVGAVEMSSLSWTMPTSGVFQAYKSDAHVQPKILTPFFKYFTDNFTYGGASNYKDGTGGVNPNNQNIYYKDSNFTSVDALKSAMNGVYLYYELATPTETSFTTASLVTENAEIPLSNNDGTLIGKCTEELSESPGFIDAKIKLSDSDGECYSNKIQLHIERSPQ